MKRLLLTLLFLLECLYLTAQTGGSVFSVIGRGGVGTTFVTDYQTIGINPANLGWEKTFRDPKWTVGLGETTLSMSTEGLSRSDMWDMMGTTETFNNEQKEEVVNRFSNASISFNIEAMILGLSFNLPNKYGSVAFSVKDRFNTFFQSNENVAEFLFFGEQARYFPNLMINTEEGRLNADGEWETSTIGAVVPNPRYSGEPALEMDESYTYTDNDSVRRRQYIAKGLADGDTTKRQSYEELLDGSRLSMTWYREYNFSYGVTVYDSYNFSMQMGAGIRYIQGLMVGEMGSGYAGYETMFATSFLNRNQVLYNAIKAQEVAREQGLPVEYDILEGDDPDNRDILTKMINPRPVGEGFGFDLGISMRIGKNIRLGASVTNIGKMTWSGDVYKTDLSENLREIHGEGYNSLYMANNTGGVQLAGSSSLFDWNIDDTEKEVELPSTIRIGASYDYFRLFHVGVDVVIPRNDVPGNIEKPMVGIGGDFSLTKFIKISLGSSWGGYEDRFVNVPAGITLTNKKNKFELGLSTRDIRTWIYDSGYGNTMSLSMGVLRLKI